MTNLYVITLENGEILQEYGSSEADVRAFVERIYSHSPIKSIVLYT